MYTVFFNGLHLNTWNSLGCFKAAQIPRMKRQRERGIQIINCREENKTQYLKCGEREMNADTKTENKQQPRYTEGIE